MKVLSLFSGVGGFDLGLERAGMETVALCEWDKKAAHVLRRHWPDIPIYGDVSDVTGAQLIADGVHPDLVAFGSPCQDLSVAGKRAGLAGERSGLFHEAVRIIRELRELTDGTLPRWVIWENVVGALNSNGGADFGAVLDAMADLGALFSEWAVLDAQNFGVAQRRRRVFLVSCLNPGAARGCPDPLLPVREGGPRDLVPLRAAWKESATRSRRGASDRSVLGEFTRRDGFREYDDVAATLQGFMGTGGGNVPVVMRQREGKPGGGKGPLLSEESLTLATANDQTIFQPVGFSHTQGLDAQPSTEAFPTLRREGSGHAVLVPYTDVVETLTSADLVKHQGSNQAVSAGLLSVYGIQGNMIGRQDQNGPQGSGVADNGEPMFTLTAVDRHAVATPYAVRRLLPIECERLMGWPDDWTRWDADGKEQADSHRYKQCGNGVASPVAEWVGRHIFAADAIGRAR
jgi:DNA (cytosine-5)-methyltransferase 1